jgi:hypothetical protein
MSFHPLSLGDNARALVYSTYDFDPIGPQNFRLMARDIASGREMLVSGSQGDQFPLFVGLSGDGGRVMFQISGPQFGAPTFGVDTSTGKVTPWPRPDGEFATTGALSCDGILPYWHPLTDVS